MIKPLIVPLLFMLLATPIQASSHFATAPCWVISTACVKAKIAGVGLSHIRYQDNAQLATLQAKRDAIASAAMAAKVQVKSQLSYLQSDYDSGSKRDRYHTSQQASVQTSHIQLSGSKVQAKWLDKDGILYILVVVEQFSDITNKQAVKNGEHDQGAQWLTSVTTHPTSANPVSAKMADHPIIKSNMEYANQLSQSIRQEVQILNF